ncbi:DUF2061 domain-containing protein [Saccharophagus sp. K07]|uniref:DUF2061 domain-containing protein n=1 Tax=Saccharophagus sp. K07 TaxID=2283636 RepID=UPI001652045A|nr:DUF2061 domain-containing protein [Saccharophagus sp. K07]MBC6903856.1 DUF2061 domain-containing protein [Saccharophagus sp. K07]
MLKTMTFAITHFTVAFTVAWLLTGNFVVGGLIALVEPAVNTVAYYFHEKAWEKIGKAGIEAGTEVKTKHGLVC